MERLRAHRSCLHQPCDLAPELVDEGNFRRAERAGTAAHKHVAVARGAAAGLLHQLLLGQDLKGNGAHPHLAARHIPQNVKLAAAVKYGDAALPAACRLRCSTLKDREVFLQLAGCKTGFAIVTTCA